MSQYLFMTVVSFNGVKPFVDFWLPEDTTSIATQRSFFDNLLPHMENKKVSKTEFYTP